MTYYQSPRISGEVADCSMPLTFDQYSNCAFGCLYCFSQYQRAIGNGKQHYIDKEVTAVSVPRIKKMFTDPDSTHFGPYIKARKVMQWGGLSDPFCGFEKKYGVGLELLRFFKEIDYPLCFSTKGTWWLDRPEYTELFKGNKKWNIKVSIITNDAAKAKIIEKGVPSPAARLKALEAIAGLGCGGATLRLRPFLLGVSDPGHVDLINSAADAGATAVSTEFFCLEQRSGILKDKLKLISECAGFDYAKIYRQYSKGSGYLRLNRNIKRTFIDEMEQATHDKGMRFYVSDAHFKERCDNGCCCGLGEDWNYSRGQFCEALIICKRNGTVSWADISHDMEHLQIQMTGAVNVGSSDRRAMFDDFTLYDYLRWLWNNPKAGQSPYKMFEGVMQPKGFDKDGNLVYELNEERL